MYNYKGPMLWVTSLIHDSSVNQDSILQLIDAEINKLIEAPIKHDLLDRTLVKLRADYYSTVGGFFGFGRADLLACFALFDDNPGLINNIESEFKKVTPDLIQKTAKEYLRSSNRTVLAIIPKATEKEEM
jgi:zinc protease